MNYRQKREILEVLHSCNLRYPPIFCLDTKHCVAKACVRFFASKMYSQQLLVGITFASSTMRIIGIYTRLLVLPVILSLPHAATDSTTGFAPLTTVFTPPPECSSLTIVHRQRYVAIHTGCIGADASCCPPTGRANNTYSPLVQEYVRVAI